MCVAAPSDCFWMTRISFLAWGWGRGFSEWEDFLIVGLVWSWQNLYTQGYIFPLGGCAETFLIGFSWWLTAFDYDPVTLFGWTALASCSDFSIKAPFYPLNPSGAAVIVEEPFSTFVVAIPDDDWAQLVVDKRSFHKEAVSASVVSIILRAPKPVED